MENGVITFVWILMFGVGVFWVFKILLPAFSFWLTLRRDDRKREILGFFKEIKKTKLGEF